MPWTGSVYVRQNPDYSGSTVWQQDQQAGIKVIDSRHDVHDQDIADGISSCLNINGANALAATLDFNTHTTSNLALAVATGQAVNWDQFDPVETQVAANTLAISQIDPGNADNVITAFSWDGVVFTGERVNPDLTVDIKLFTDFKDGGSLKHLSTVSASAASVSIDPTAANRHTLSNNEAINLTFTPLPTGADAELGENYEIEGQVIVTNGGGTPGAITITTAGVSAGDVLGTNSQVPNAKSVLSYMIYRTTGDAYNQTYIWSTA